MDQLLGAYQFKVESFILIDGANNLGLEGIKSTHMEQGQAIVSMGAMNMMISNGIGVPVKVVSGTTELFQTEIIKLMMTS